MTAPTVELSYQQKRKQGTVLGACCSIAVTTMILYYGATSFWSLMSYTSYKVNYGFDT